MIKNLRVLTIGAIAALTIQSCGRKKDDNVEITPPKKPVPAPTAPQTTPPPVKPQPPTTPKITTPPVQAQKDETPKEFVGVWQSEDSEGLAVKRLTISADRKITIEEGILAATPAKGQELVVSSTKTYTLKFSERKVNLLGVSATVWYQVDYINKDGVSERSELVNAWEEKDGTKSLVFNRGKVTETYTAVKTPAPAPEPAPPAATPGQSAQSQGTTPAPVPPAQSSQSQNTATAPAAQSGQSQQGN